jgi:hypothetical protein
MAREDPAAFSMLRKRAQKLNSLVDKRTHPQVSLVLQRAFGGLSASAETLSLIFRVGNSIATEGRRPMKRSAVVQITIGIKLKLIQERVLQPTEAAESMRPAETSKCISFWGSGPPPCRRDSFESRTKAQEEAQGESREEGVLWKSQIHTLTWASLKDSVPEDSQFIPIDLIRRPPQPLDYFRSLNRFSIA